MTTEIIPREKCRFCKVYLPKNCLNDICLKCSKWCRLAEEVYHMKRPYQIEASTVSS
jgi:hypothetical protein